MDFIFIAFRCVGDVNSISSFKYILTFNRHLKFSLFGNPSFFHLYSSSVFYCHACWPFHCTTSPSCDKTLSIKTVGRYSFRREMEAAIKRKKNRLILVIIIAGNNETLRFTQLKRCDWNNLFSSLLTELLRFLILNIDFYCLIIVLHLSCILKNILWKYAVFLPEICLHWNLCDKQFNF